MPLQEKLDKLKEKFQSSAPKEALDIMQRATEDLKNSEIMEQVKSKGDMAPDFTLPDFQGRLVNLFEQLSKGPVVLGFYRGTW